MSTGKRVGTFLLISGIVLTGGVVISPVQAQVQVAKLTVPEDVGQFGHVVALDGDYAVLGAPWTPDDPFAFVGSAFVYKRVGSSWVEHTLLSPTKPGDNIEFGKTVAIDADTIAVGEPHNGFDGDELGFVYIYRRDGGIWMQEAKLNSSNYPEHEGFGFPVALDGDVMVAGAYGGIGVGVNRAYIFRRTGSVWAEEALLVPDDPQFQHCFGCSIAVDDDLAAVGTPWDDDACESDPGCLSGAVYVFRFLNGQWTQESKLVASDAGENLRFGTSVAVYGTEVFVGSRAGLYVFAYENGVWEEKNKLLSSWPDAIESLATDGFLLVAGVPGDDSFGSNSGAAYVFSKDQTEWAQEGQLDPKDAAAIHGFGTAVSVSGDYAIVGTGGADGAYVFATNIDVPAVSAWGLVAVALLVLAAGTILVRRANRRTSLTELTSIIALLPGLVLAYSVRGGGRALCLRDGRSSELASRSTPASRPLLRGIG